MLIAVVSLALLVGVVLGMLGGGGAILTLPMLVYVARMDAKVAIASSLFVVGSTAITGMLVHARAGTVRWKIGAIFGLAAMTGAYGGGRIAQFIPGSVLMALFGVVMMGSAIAMLRGRTVAKEASGLRLGPALGLGVAVGAVSGLVGAGGGFLIVPALTLFAGMAVREAIGTSLLVIAMQSFAGLAGHIAHVSIEWHLVLAVAAASVTGSLLGATFTAKVPAHALRRGFAWLVVVMGLFVFAKQLPSGAHPAPQPEPLTPKAVST